MGKWKAVRNNLKNNPDAPVELYNLSEDIGEENNVANNHPGIVQEMHRIIQQEYENTEHFNTDLN